MVDIPPHSRHPLVIEPFHIIDAEAVGVGHLAPHHEAQAIRPVQEPGVLDFLVFAAAIEAHGFAELDVVFQGGARGGCEESGGPVALVEEQGVEVGLMVETEGAVARRPGDRPHAGRGGDFVEEGARCAGEEADAEGIESWVLRGPESGVFVESIPWDVRREML